MPSVAPTPGRWIVTACGQSLHGISPGTHRMSSCTSIYFLDRTFGICASQATARFLSRGVGLSGKAKDVDDTGKVLALERFFFPHEAANLPGERAPVIFSPSVALEVPFPWFGQRIEGDPCLLRTQPRTGWGLRAWSSRSHREAALSGSPVISLESSGGLWPGGRSWGHGSGFFTWSLLSGCSQVDTPQPPRSST